MASIPGPRKLILIDSGVYPYAEIDLEESVHLSGRNNAGKSSLLNALQFLYIDDIKLMHFPTSNFQGKTKPFYFKPGGRSTILVEADTKWGVRTVGFHGLGAAAGCDWQRFGFDGPYCKDDFVDPETQQPRPWDAVRARLAPAGYVELSQAQLRAALRGSAGERGGFRLELVPGGGSYDTFIEVFRQLLTLRRSRPDDLKNLLISVVEPELVSGDERGRGTVALGSVVGEDYAKAYAGNQRYEKIRAAEKIGLNLFGDYDRLRELQALLPRTLRRSYREAAARLADRTARAEEAQRAEDEARLAEGEWKQVRIRLDQEIKGKEQELGRTKGRLEDAQALEERLLAEPKEMQEVRLRDLRQEAAQARMDLSAFLGTDGAAVLRARIHKHRQDQQACVQTSARLSALDQAGARPSWMELLEEYPDEERGPLLRLVNPAILMLPDGPDGLEIVEPRSLGRLLSVVSAASQDGIYKGAGLRVNLAALPSPGLSLEDPTVRAREIENLETQAEHLEREIRRLEELERNSRAREKLVESLAAMDAQERTLSQSLANIAGWEEAAGKLPALTAQLAELEGAAARLEAAREEAMDQHESNRTRARVEANRAAALSREAQELRGTILADLEQRAQAMGLDLSPDELPAGPAMTDPEFTGALGQLAEAWSEATRLDQSVARRMEELDQQLDGMIAGDRETRIEQLRDLIEGLPDQKAQLEAAWQHIAVIAKTSFSNLLRDFETLGARVTRLNRAMARFSVSNLSGIQLRLVENSSRTTVLRQFTQEDGLFADRGLAEKAKLQVGDWISQGEVFRLFDLFRVELEVNKDGEKEVYASLDAESTGTAITLKVVFLAHLLRDLFRSRTEVRLLIFVDEVDTLDDMNQETIRECARELGFTLIMASPNPANANRLYFLRPEGKVTYIYPEESLELVFRDEPALEEAAE